MRRVRSLTPVLVGLLLCCALPAPALSAADTYFSPGGGVRQHLLQAIREARQQIDVAVYQFTAIELADALVAAKRRGVQVRLLTDQDKARPDATALRILRAAGVPIRALGVPEQSLMHHKFAVFDDRLVATGSYNWTVTAERANYENLVLLDEPAVVSRFKREFEKLWREAKE